MKITDFFSITPLTAGEVAQYIQRPKEPLAAAVARFRNWEKMGIIKATGVRHPGTGRKKRYSKDAILRAVILQVLTDALGARAVSVAPALGRLAQEFEVITRGKSDPNYIVIGREPAGVSMSVNVVDLPRLQAHIQKSDLDVHTIMNVPRIYDRILDKRLMLEPDDIP